MNSLQWDELKFTYVYACTWCEFVWISFFKVKYNRCSLYLPSQCCLDKSTEVVPVYGHIFSLFGSHQIALTIQAQMSSAIGGVKTCFHTKLFHNVIKWRSPEKKLSCLLLQFSSPTRAFSLWKWSLTALLDLVIGSIRKALQNQPTGLCLSSYALSDNFSIKFYKGSIISFWDKFWHKF